MTLVTLQDAELAFGLHPLLDRANLVVERRGAHRPHRPQRHGQVVAAAGHRGPTGARRRPAADARRPRGRAGRAGAGAAARLVRCANASPCAAGSTPSTTSANDGALEARLVEYLHRFGLDEATAPESASGGEKKRAALALALALAPDLLLLDEPTNHLDLDGISPVEELVVKARAAIVITHDRAFLDRVATRIVELDRGLLRSYPGNFAAYETAQGRRARGRSDGATASSIKFWAQEEAWIRKGIEARRTRDEGRVRRLEALRRERSERRARLGNVKLAIDAGERSGRLVAELSHVSKAFDGRTAGARSHAAHHARRPAGPDRRQRRGQVDAARS